MKNKILIIVILVIASLLLVKYCHDLDDHYYYDGPSGITAVPAIGEIPHRTTLPQAWDDDTREKFWYTSQGSQIMPYKWFMWLEQSDNESYFRSADFIDSLGYLPMESSESNPGGLPIGFAMTRPMKGSDIMMGLTCAACHTNQLNYNGTNLLIDGAPTLANFVMFYEELIKSLDATHTDDAKFDRFARNVLADKYTESAASALRVQVQQKTIAAANRQAVNDLPDNYPKDFTSYARLDAFGNIANAGSAFALNDLSNRNSTTGPVSYPFLWGTHQSDVVQWNASAPNTPVVGPLVRNVGEVVGVFGDLSIHSPAWWQKLLGIKVAYSSTVDYQGLGELETYIKDLRSPAWPEQYLPKLDVNKIAEGRILFDQHCASCHQVIARKDEGQRYVSNKTLLTDLGTDPITAWNIQNHTAKTLILEGTKQDVLIGDTFGSSTTAIDIPVNGVIGVVLKRPVKALNAGLAPGRSAGDDDSHKKPIKELLEENLHQRAKIANSANHETEVLQAPTALGANAQEMDLDSLVYKGRPLNGIWATAPYLHNGSVPNLWELMKPPADRIKTFKVGSRKFDADSVGYVTYEGPSEFNVLKPNGDIMPGNSNLGHDYGTGNLTDEEKWKLIEFMKSL